MTTISIFDVTDIKVKSKYTICDIDFWYNNSVIRIELKDEDAKNLMEQLEYIYHKDTYDNLKTTLEGKIAKLKNGGGDNNE